uniref:AMP-binding domain-containing protein n=1 Tax=Rhabditophanes sp. KR3021 TaxID=114890 RepID=A0AC35U0S5_9BILA
MSIFFRRCNSNFVSTTNFAHPAHAKNALLYLENKSVKSYGDIDTLSGRYASLLNSKYAIHKGDRVLARVTKSEDSVALYLAVLRLGAIYVPVNPAYTPTETNHYVDDVQPKAFITLAHHKDIQFLPKITHILSESTLKTEALNTTPDFSIEPVSPTDIASICYTSGTTGLPKGAMITHGALTKGGECLTSLWQFRSRDVLLHALPFYHVHGMFLSLSCCLFSQSSAIWLPKFDLPKAIKYMNKASVMSGVPTFYSRLLDSKDFKPSAYQNIRLFISGSAPLTSAVWDKFYLKTGNCLISFYATHILF